MDLYLYPHEIVLTHSTDLHLNTPDQDPCIMIENVEKYSLTMSKKQFLDRPFTWIHTQS